MNAYYTMLLIGYIMAFWQEGIALKGQAARRFPAAIGSSGSATNRCKALHKRRGTYGTPSDDGVPKVPLKSLYLWYSDFASVQLFASISGTKPLAPT